MKSYPITDTHVLKVRANRKDASQPKFAYVYANGEKTPKIGSHFKSTTPLDEIKYWAKKQISAFQD